LTSITLGTSTLDNYGYSISGWRAESGGNPYLKIMRHFNSAAGVDVMVMDAQGRVGIGTTNPSQLLDVNGATRLRGALYDKNNSYGTSGQVLSTTGSGGVDWVTVSSGSGTVTSIGTSGAITGGSPAITTTGTISHSTSAGYKHIPTGGSSGQFLKYSSSGTATWATPNDPTIAGTGAVGIGTTAFTGERTITSNTDGTNAWDVGTPDYLARIENLPAGTWLIRADAEIYYSLSTTRFAARIIGNSSMMATQHPEPGNNGLVWNNAGSGSYNGGGHNWRYIACAGPQDETADSGYAPWRYLGYSFFGPLTMAGVVVTTQAGGTDSVWFQVKDFDTTGGSGHTFKIRNVQLTAIKVTS